jgi:hypothetical protein
MQMTYSPQPLELTELAFEALRAYRVALKEEEDRVSYWRRIVQGRVDMLNSGLVSGGISDELSIEQVVEALGTTGSGANRVALMRVAHTEPFPELPTLTEIAQSSAEVDVSAHLAALGDAERTLSEYRGHIHERLNAATQELIARYHRDPKLALTLLDL